VAARKGESDLRFWEGEGEGEGEKGKAGGGEGLTAVKGENDLGLGIVLFILFFKTGSVWSGSIGLSFFKPEPNRTGWFFYFLIGLFDFFYRFSFFG
jgi:hypothetical protein